jgi:hypothetical protein
MRTAHREDDVIKAIKIAVDACEYIDGMMQFEKRFEKREERRSVETIDYVFKYAPLVFDRRSLERVATLLKAQKRIDKIATDDLAKDLAQANELMWSAHRLWTVLRKIPGVRQDELRTRLGGAQEHWRWIAESWAELNMIQRMPHRGSYRLSATTDLATHARGKCSSCGATGKASMGTFLVPIDCPRCKTKAEFVMLPVALESTR